MKSKKKLNPDYKHAYEHYYDKFDGAETRGPHYSPREVFQSVMMELSGDRFYDGEAIGYHYVRGVANLRKDGLHSAVYWVRAWLCGGINV